ncbi:MAG: hypothetical protein IT459_20265 [Planctomycetes bacterium]|nr:hypothetical protein [Planctomycetota bacterium]
MGSATKAFDPQPEDLKTFDPAAESLARIGALWFRAIPPCLFTLHAARAGLLGEVSDEAWIRFHRRLRTALQIANRCTEGLGSRLEATEIVPDAMAIEKRAREIIHGLLKYELFLSGSPIQVRRDQKAIDPAMLAAAGELQALGDMFCSVPPQADPARVDTIAHAPDFSWIRAGRHTYVFERPQQAHVIRILHAEWERAGRRDGHGVMEVTLGELVDAATDKFRVGKLFRGHPVLDGALRRHGKSVWALHLNQVASTPPTPG